MQGAKGRPRGGHLAVFQDRDVKYVAMFGQGTQMESREEKQELPVLVQTGALIALWAIWFLVVIVVIPLENYDNPALICSVLFAVFPLVLVATGGFFLQHATLTENLIHQAFWCFIAGLTLFGIVIFLTGCVLSTVLVFAT